MFLTSDMMLVSKSDLLPYLPFSVDAVVKDAQEVNHELEVIRISALTGEGIDQWCAWLLKKVDAKRISGTSSVPEHKKNGLNGC